MIRILLCLIKSWELGDMTVLQLSKDQLPLQPSRVGRGLFSQLKIGIYRLSNEPAFRWWVKHILKRRGKIISKMTIEEAMILDAEYGDTLWQDAINKGMANIRIAFEILEECEGEPVGYTQITCHLIFYMKMELTRKARYVAGGHLPIIYDVS